MQKLAFIYSYKMSSWVSCQKIVFNLHKAYSLKKEYDISNFNFSSTQTLADQIQACQQIRKSSPDTIVFLDHKPHPFDLIRFLLPLYEDTPKKPRFIFHVFGDFSLKYDLWDKLSFLLKDYSVEFIVASDRQKILLDKFLIPPHSSQICHFPVDKKEFSYVPQLRVAQRKEWKLKPDDIAFVFTGRLSRQKRIHSLISVFAEVVERTNDKKGHLFLYGTTDNIGDPFVGIWEMEGEYFHKINKIYKSFPQWIQDRIHFMGGVPNAELKSVYCGADMLVNLSVHNDEDFGMSVAEALCSGLPAMLTDWGGLASFELPTVKESTIFIPVRIGKISKIISIDHVRNAMKNVLSKGPCREREKISKEALKSFDVESANLVLKKILKGKFPNFKAFSPFFEKVLNRNLISITPYITERKVIHSIFREVYSAYVRKP